jgi:hypothetical protein
LFSVRQRRQRLGLVVKLPQTLDLRGRPGDPEPPEPKQATVKTQNATIDQATAPSATLAKVAQSKTAIDRQSPFAKHFVLDAWHLVYRVAWSGSSRRSVMATFFWRSSLSERDGYIFLAIIPLRA